MEKIRDLLAPRSNDLKVRENSKLGVYVDGLSEHYVTDDKQITEALRKGTEARAVGFCEAR